MRKFIVARISNFQNDDGQSAASGVLGHAGAVPKLVPVIELSVRTCDGHHEI